MTSTYTSTNINTTNALISEKDRLYYFYVTCNMTNEETCQAMGYYCTKGKNKGKASRWFLETNVRKYNIRRPQCLIDFNTRRTTYLTYGVERTTQLPEVQAKMKATCLERYGTENVYASEYGKQKIKQTCLQKYGVENYTQTEEFKQKARETDLKRYGVYNHTQAESVKAKARKTNLERYGTENVYASEYGKQKIKQTNLERYGVENYTQTEEYKKKAKQTNLEKYGVEYYVQSDEYKEKYKQTCLKKYGVDNTSKVPEIIQKIHEIRKANGSLNKSKPEDDIYELLLQKFPKVIHHLKDNKKYPFNCDFYIPEIDTWIEYQGVIDHGHWRRKVLGPYDENNQEHQRVLKIWQEKANNGHPRYTSMIKTWTVRDPLKRKTAKDNGLNWLEFFTMDEFIRWYESI